jgi:integrase
LASKKESAMSSQKSDIEIVQSNNKKFSPKTYLEKDRMYRPVSGSSRISKLYVWDTVRKEYLASESKSYMARRYEPDADGVLARRTQFFDTLDEARKWQAGVKDISSKVGASAAIVAGVSSPKLSEVVAIWKKRSFPGLAHGTQLQYEKLLRLHFGSILNLSIHEITPQRVDSWLDKLREVALLNSKRKSLNHELTLLSTVLRYYLEDEDDLQFHFPIKERHWRDCLLQKKKKKSSKDFTVEEFFRFRESLKRGISGEFFANLATVQYFQALRISEAAAIHKDDVQLNKKHSQSRLMIQRSICWPRKKGLPSYVQVGFKNSDSFDDGVKEQPVFPESYDALQSMIQQSESNASGLLFELDGKHLEYRQIQHAYDLAFRRAKLSYTGTHVLRHGGCRNLYNESGDLSVAQQLLGDKSEQATKVYAQRKASALTEVAQEHWQEKVGNGHESGCNWLQEEVEIKKPSGFLRVIK